ADIGDARDVLALDLDGGARLASEPRHGLWIRERLREQELHRDALVQLDVPPGDDDAHAADAEHLVDAVLPGEHVALANSGCGLGLLLVVHSSYPLHGCERRMRAPSRLILLFETSVKNGVPSQNCV